MKKFVLSLLAVLSVSLYISCDDVDDNELPAEMPDGASMMTQAELERMNVAAYSILNTLGGGEETGILNNPFYWWSIMSDDCYGSGGLSDYYPLSLHHFTLNHDNQYEYDYVILLSGIARVNVMIESIDDVFWTADEMTQRNQMLGEAFFLRGLYYMWFTQLFGDVPLFTSSLAIDDRQRDVSADEYIYPQIISDFVSAKNLMKPERANGSGHADKYCAESFLARAYMFWAGFYQKTPELAISAPDITLVEQEGCPGGSLTKADVVDALKDIVTNGGYQLLPDFRSLWQYSNSYLLSEALDGKQHAYKFIADMKLSDCFDQPGNGNGNPEEIFQIQFRRDNIYTRYSNKISYYWGLRGSGPHDNGNRDLTYPFNQGLGMGVPSYNIWNDWIAEEQNSGTIDLRLRASIIDLANKDEVASYTYYEDGCEETGYAVKKYADVNLDANSADNQSWWLQHPDIGMMRQGECFADFYLMRYSDVLLMLTELTGDAQYMNRVRIRAGLTPIPYSLQAVQDERRWELAFEGLRFNDMRRWSGINTDTKSYAARALQQQDGRPIIVRGKKNPVSMRHMTSSWAERYVDTNGFLPKPKSQINLFGGGVKQNPGWDSNNPYTQYMAIY